jgi:hypothetical protein
MAPPSQTASSAAVSRSIPALITAAGLPVDTFSLSIVSFARFFSLPIKPELMAAIRKQALAPSPTPSPAAENPSNSTAGKSREALSLAAAAAAGKGVELNPKGLETFAEAIDPGWQKRQDSGGRNPRGRQNKDQHEQEKENVFPKIGLKEMALSFTEQEPLLAVLNRLPGKNGQRWIVLPFSFVEGGTEYKVSLRILLDGENQTESVARQMVLDIAEGEETGRSWLFLLETAHNLTTSLTVHLQPELPSGALDILARELSQLMEMPPDRVFVKNRTESFPSEMSCRDDLLCSINEAV